jgi:hypothetical protein
MRSPARGARPALLLSLALLTTAAPCLAQAAEPEEPLETDRPDITETSTVVGQGRLQIETALQFERVAEDGDRERRWFTPTLFRYGFHPRWEARLETDGYTRARISEAGAGTRRTAGYSPLEVGLKHHLQDARPGSRRPSLGAIAHLGFPSGSTEFATRKVTGSLKLAADWDLAPQWALGVNAGLSVDEDDDGKTFAAGLLTASVARDLTDRLRTYIELAGQTAEARSGRAALLLDGGFAYLFNPNTQVDLAFGTGLAGRTSPDFYWTVGFSRRW